MRLVLLAVIALVLSACQQVGSRVVEWDCDDVAGTCDSITIQQVPIVATPKPTYGITSGTITLGQTFDQYIMSGATFLWEQIDGPSGAVIQDATARNIYVSMVDPGRYIFRCLIDNPDPDADYTFDFNLDVTEPGGTPFPTLTPWPTDTATPAPTDPATAIPTATPDPPETQVPPTATLTAVPFPTNTPAPLISNIQLPATGTFRRDVLIPGMQIYTGQAITVTQTVGLDGAQAIVLKATEWSVTSTTYLSFNLSADATVYVAYAGVTPPAWLESWTDTGSVLGTSVGPFALYTLDYLAGPVVLGGNREPPGNATRMYLVLVEPL
jgi:hypothetical protein